LTDAQKYALLEKAGARNQQFMANSPYEAAHFFPRLLPPKEDHWADFDDDEAPNFDDVAGNEDENGDSDADSATVDTNYCDVNWCGEIEWKLADALERRRIDASLMAHNDEPASSCNKTSNSPISVPKAAGEAPTKEAPVEKGIGPTAKNTEAVKESNKKRKHRAGCFLGSVRLGKMAMVLTADDSR